MITQLFSIILLNFIFVCFDITAWIHWGPKLIEEEELIKSDVKVSTEEITDLIN